MSANIGTKVEWIGPAQMSFGPVGSKRTPVPTAYGTGVVEDVTIAHVLVRLDEEYGAEHVQAVSESHDTFHAHWRIRDPAQIDKK